MPDTLSIRPLADSDHGAVRDLSIVINRALAQRDRRIEELESEVERLSKTRVRESA